MVEQDHEQHPAAEPTGLQAADGPAEPIALGPEVTAPLVPSLPPLASSIAPTAPTTARRWPSWLTVPPAWRPPRRHLILGALVLGPVTAVNVTLLALFVARGRGPVPAATTPAPASAAPTGDGGGDHDDGGDRPDGAAVEGATLDSTALALAAPSEFGPPTPPIWRLHDLPTDTTTFVEATVGRRPFVVALSTAGVPRQDIHRLLAAFAPVRRFDRCGPKDTFVVAKDKAKGMFLGLEYRSSPFDVWQARTKETGVDARKLVLRVEHVPVAKALAVDGELRASLLQSGLDDDLLVLLDDALHGHLPLSEVRPGARFRFLTEEDRVEGAFARYADLDALEYLPSPSAAAKSPLRLYRWGTGKNAAYYDAKGRRPVNAGWHAPVPLARLSSRYNPRRMHPVLHVVMPHNGVDYAAPPGTPVYATAPGVVQSAGNGGPCGNMVQILHPGGLVSAYCHLSRFAAGVHAGQHMEGRQLLGYVGQTGRVTGPHLHFAVRRGEIFIDPLALKLDGYRVIPPEERDAFTAHRTELDARLDRVTLPNVGAGAAAALDATDGGAEQEIIFEEPP